MYFIEVIPNPILRLSEYKIDTCIFRMLFDSNNTSVPYFIAADFNS